MRDGLKEFAGKNKEIEDVIRSIDTDKSGEIDYTEFIAATMEKNLYLKEERLNAAFRLFDKDGDGKITAQELMDVLSKEDGNKDKKYYENMIKEVDKNGDGVIDYSEFLEMMGAKWVVTIRGKREIYTFIYIYMYICANIYIIFFIKSFLVKHK